MPFFLRNQNMIKYGFFFSLIPIFLFASLSYTVDFKIEEKNNPYLYSESLDTSFFPQKKTESYLRTKQELIPFLSSASQLKSLQKKHASSLGALRHRADLDIPVLLKVLQSLGYFEGQVRMQVEEQWPGAHVTVWIDPGPLYHIQTIYVDFEQKIVLPESFQEKLHSFEGAFAKTSLLMEIEQELLGFLKERGYPSSHLADKKIVVDGREKTISALFYVCPGKIRYFGPSTISGLLAVHPHFIDLKKEWAAGELYDQRKVKATQQALIDCGLFHSVSIEPLTDKEESGEGVPLKIEVIESPPRTVHIGASYQTFFGPGITFGWEHRNIGGMGRKLHFQGDVTQKTHSGIATFSAPHFSKQNEQLLITAEAFHESIRAYTQKAYNLSGGIEKRVGKKVLWKILSKTERIDVTATPENGTFYLLSFPFYIRWSNVNDVVNPSKGSTAEYFATPTLSLLPSSPSFIQKISYNFYYPLIGKERLTLAQKITLGSLSHKKKSSIPIPIRFFGGSEEDLRGYNYYTISPIKNGKLVGGFSEFFYTLEARFRILKSLGLIHFWDVGNVYPHSLPFYKDSTLFLSTGVGIRYFSYVGPLRVDVGFPLRRRPEWDRPYRILLSVGQTF
jgi:translocation and assembly module TamA